MLVSNSNFRDIEYEWSQIYISYDGMFMQIETWFIDGPHHRPPAI